MRKTLCATLALFLLCATSAFFGSYYGARSLTPVSADQPTGNGGPAGITGATDTSLTPTGSTLGLSTTQPNANTWSSLQTFSAGIASSAVSSIGAGSGGCAATVVGICGPSGQGTTNIIGLALGPQQAAWSCSSSCTVGDSTKLCFYNSNASGPGAGTCDYMSAGGNRIFGCAGSGCSTNNALLTTGSGRITTNALVSNVANGFGGTCTEASAVSCTITLTHTFSAGLCLGVDVTNFTNVKASLSGTTLTLSTSSSASDQLIGFCFGNGGT